METRQRIQAETRRDDEEVTNTAQSQTASRPLQFTGRVRSFRCAIVGILRMLRCQQNAWIHLIVTIGVVAAGFVFQLSRGEWCWIVLALAIVWTAEALNTAFEFLADAASPSFHPVVRDAKDVAAGAVLITAIAAAIIGVIIFWPHIAALLSQR
jgi:diacylglycerol kinase (ATP)